MAFTYRFPVSDKLVYTFSTDSVALRINDELAVQELSQRFFQRILSDEEYALLAGADPGDDVGIAPTPRPEVGYPHLVMLLTKPMINRGKRLGLGQCSYADSQDELGILRVELPLIKLPSGTEGNGCGSLILAKHILAAQRVGIGRIEGHADGRTHLNRRYNGYYTLPRLGFDGDLTTEQRQQLPPPFAHMRRVSELMQTPAGRDWWRANGSDIDVAFDTNPGFPSMSTLQRYLGQAWDYLPAVAPPVKRVVPGSSSLHP